MQESAIQQFNIGHLCTRQQCDKGKSDQAAMIWLSPDLTRGEYTFADIDHKSNRVANALLQLGFGKGDRIFIFTPKLPEQIITFLGILKIQAIACILFPTFGHDALLDRIGDGRADCIITSQNLLRRIQEIRPQVASIKTILLVDGDDRPAANVLSLRKRVETASDQYDTPLTPADTPSVLHYTSGSTGKPKGALHAHRSILSQTQTFMEVFQPRQGDIYWCTADQAWVTGVSYGIIGPWSAGITQVHYAGAYDAEKWLTILEQERVNLWYTAPTALRMLRQEDPELFERFKLPQLRHIFSVGEPLNPEVIEWSRKTLGRDIYDTYFQTETGSIMVSNRPGLPVKLGSMGQPVQGIQAEILSNDGAILPANQPGHLCFKPGWPSMLTGYLNNEEAFKKKVVFGFFHTGDNAYRDKDDYIWFIGRADDLIKTAGHLISPFEIESSLLEIEEIAEAGVIGAPDAMLFEKVVAFIKLKKDCAWSEELEIKTRLHVSNRVSTFAAPREIYAVDQVPKNKSGKIMRRLLKARYLGIDEGDTSTMEE